MVENKRKRAEAEMVIIDTFHEVPYRWEDFRYEKKKVVDVIRFWEATGRKMPKNNVFETADDLIEQFVYGEGVIRLPSAVIEEKQFLKWFLDLLDELSGVCL